MTKVDPDNESTFHVCVIQSRLPDAVLPKKKIIKDVENHRFPDNTVFAIKLALEEALTNAIKHGNRNDSSKRVTVRYAVNEEKLVVIVRDEGDGFEPDNVPDPTEPERLSVPCGRGIMLIRAYMDEVAYRDHGRELYFMKRRG